MTLFFKIIKINLIAKELIFSVFLHMQKNRERCN